MKTFIFKSYNFDKDKSLASFSYAFEDGFDFTETVSFEVSVEYDDKLLDRALFLAFIIMGTSYYKTFPTTSIKLDAKLDQWQADFFTKVYQEGMSQFVFENNLKREDLVKFKASKTDEDQTCDYNKEGIIALQSGGKDSLLLASLLQEHNKNFESLYVSSSDYYPKFLDDIGSKLIVSTRLIDKDRLIEALKNNAKNGHVPITYIIQSLAIIQAILSGKNKVLTSIAHEGEEPHSLIGDLPINHQWSKTWAAEKDLAEYVARYLSPKLLVGSPLRQFSELRVSELFIKHSWNKYGHHFSSCNLANYQQGNDNTELRWCGDCPKCANSYLLFAPFLPAEELKSIFGGQDLFARPSLTDTFKGLLGIDNVPKPFECIGEVDELRLAYHKAEDKGGYQPLPFDVPVSTFDYMKTYPAQDWAIKVIE